jgi:hypothetical protein
MAERLRGVWRDDQSKAIEAQVLCMRCKRGWGSEGAVTKKGGQRLSVAMQEVSCMRVNCVQAHHAQPCMQDLQRLAHHAAQHSAFVAALSCLMLAPLPIMTPSAEVHVA